MRFGARGGVAVTLAAVATAGACGGGNGNESGGPDAAGAPDVGATSSQMEAGSGPGPGSGSDATTSGSDGGGAPQEAGVGGGADAGTSSGDGGGTTGGSDAGYVPDAPGADANFGPATTWVYNLVSPTDFMTLSGFLAGTGSGDLTGITQDFYKVYGDDYDFIYLFAEVTGQADVSVIVRWDGTSGVGLPAMNDMSYGSPARLKSVISFGTLLNGTVYEVGPTLHETLHHWSMYLDSSFGFDTASGHWGYGSANGLHGGFDSSSVVCRDNGQKPTGSPPACPLTSSKRMNIRLAPFSPCCVADIKPYSPIELYLMGLVPASQVQPLWVMDNENYDGPVTSDAGTGNIVAMDYDVASFHVVTIDDIIAKEGMRPAATQTDFRGAFVLVTQTAATSVQMERYARWARRFSGEEVDPTTGVMSFTAATGGRATMTTRLK